MTGLGPIVATLWKELGLAPPAAPVGTSFDFELGATSMSLRLADNGETVVVRGRIGWLDGNPHEAGDQLGRVLRLGLGLTMLNAAVLDAAEAEDLLDRDRPEPVPVHVVALARLSVPDSILSAVQAVLTWQSACENILNQGDDGARPEAAPIRPAVADGDMIIFQP